MWENPYAGSWTITDILRAVAMSFGKERPRIVHFVFMKL
jgi:hypothetical protein